MLVTKREDNQNGDCLDLYRCGRANSLSADYYLI